MKRNKRQTIANRRSRVGSYHEKVKLRGTFSMKIDLSNGAFLYVRKLRDR